MSTCLLYMEGKAPWSGTPKIRGLGRGGNSVQPHILKKCSPSMRFTSQILGLSKPETITHLEKFCSAFEKHFI
jgi:hypothetical protein